MSMGTKEATGRGADAPWTAQDIVSFRWGKMYNAGSGMGGKLSALAHVVNPCFHADESPRDQGILEDAYAVLTYMLGQACAMAVWGELQAYLSTPKDSSLFVGADGLRHEDCDYAHPAARGFQGAQWWFKVPPPHCFQWGTLRKVAMQVLKQTVTETAAERHYSQLDNTQSSKRASMAPEKGGRLTFVKSEIQHGIDLRSSNFQSPEDLEVFDLEDGLRPPPPPPTPPQTLLQTPEL